MAAQTVHVTPLPEPGEIPPVAAPRGVMSGWCPGTSALCGQFWAELAGELLGSPQAMVRLHLFMVWEAVATVVLLLAQVIVFVVFFDSTSASEMATLIALAAIPVAVTAFKIVAVRNMERRCRQLQRAFTTQNAAVATGMVQLLKSRSSKLVQIVSLFLVLWYLFCVVWNYIGPPCERFTDFSFEIQFWRLTSEEAPCSSWESVCTLLLMADATLGLTLLWAPTAVHTFQGRFVPDASQGMPLEVLDRLPEMTYGAAGCPSLEDPTCTICIEQLQDGEKIRQLPCRHCFHKGCVDSWLTRSATCPMRCPNDLWGIANGPNGGESRPAGESTATATATATAGSRPPRGGAATAPSPAVMGRQQDTGVTRQGAGGP